LSVFFLEMRKPDGTLNNLIVHKLKNKFGTKAVPTAELEITGAPGILVGEAHSGVKVIATILNITRVHNAVNMVRLLPFFFSFPILNSSLTLFELRLLRFDERLPFVETTPVVERFMASIYLINRCTYLR